MMYQLKFMATRTKHQLRRKRDLETAVRTKEVDEEEGGDERTPLYKPYFDLSFFASFRVHRVHHIDHTRVQM
jgi:hypothetical protein